MNAHRSSQLAKALGWRHVPAKLRHMTPPLVFAVMLLTTAACGRSTQGAAEGSEAGQATGAGGELIISSFGGQWAESMELAFVEPFERETGIDVTLLTEQDQARTVAAMEAGNPPDVDISVGTIDVPAFARDGLVEPIDYNTFDEDTRSQLPDAAMNEHYLTYAVFALGLCYDNEVFPDSGEQPDGWEDYFDVETFPGKRGQQTFTFDPAYEYALLADGVAVEDLYPLDVERALAKQAEIHPHVLQYTESPAVLHQMLVDRQIVMAQCFFHRMQALIDQGLERVTLVWDQARLFPDSLFVWRDAANRDNAMRFLAYIVQPEAQARWARISNVGPINPASFELIPDDIEQELPTSPAHETTWNIDVDWYTAQRDDGRTNLEWLSQDVWPAFLEEQG
jgi:putative spermidine/putrescine transport system substrate-binding protein